MEDLIFFAYQTAKGMDFLSKRKIIHRDLAARNVLLCRERIVKICDFGLADDPESVLDQTFSSTHKTTLSPSPSSASSSKRKQERLPVKWMALETLCDQPRFTTESDIWSFGIFLWELFSLGSPPYGDQKFDKNLLQKLRQGYRMSRPEYSPNFVYDLMLHCWSKIPERRPKFNEMAEEFAKHLDLDLLKNYKRIAKLYRKANFTDFDVDLEDDEDDLNSIDCHQYEGFDSINLISSTKRNDPIALAKTILKDDDEAFNGDDDYLYMSDGRLSDPIRINEDFRLDSLITDTIHSKYHHQGQPKKFNMEGDNEEEVSILMETHF
ncbi:hypothetical protein NH340_JMT01497 [Sarcoptes scabiei]|nr:hypothetical protein NH340_JMT01497 [Sarcoptes scabiei]